MHSAPTFERAPFFKYPRSNITVSVVYFSGIRSLLVVAIALVSLSGMACAKRTSVRSGQVREQLTVASSGPATKRININIATANDLETLPGIGKGLAERIVAYREKHGPFRRPEHLIIVRGISDKRFRGLRDIVTVE